MRKSFSSLIFIYLFIFFFKSLIQAKHERTSKAKVRATRQRTRAITKASDRA
jgi:hypothetical protein